MRRLVVSMGLIVAAACAQYAQTVHVDLAAAPVGPRGVRADDVQRVSESASQEYMVANLHPERTTMLALRQLNQPPAVASSYDVEIPPCSVRHLTEAAQAGPWDVSASPEVPVSGLVRTHYTDTHATTLMQSAAVDKSLTLPFVAREFFGQTAIVTLANPSPAAMASVEMAITAAGESSPRLTLHWQMKASSATEMHFGTDPRLQSLEPGFVGWARIAATVPIAASVVVDPAESERAAYGLVATPSRRSAAELYVSVFRRDFFGSTFFSVVNLGSEPAEVEIEYVGILGDCADQRYEQRGTIAGGASAIVLQDETADLGIELAPGVGANPLPEYCAGSAIIRSSGSPLVAMVNDSVDQVPGPLSQSLAYNAMTEADAGTTLLAPLWRSEHGPAKLTTGVMAWNIGAHETTALLYFYDREGTLMNPEGASATLPPRAAYTWYPPRMPDFLSDFVGWARIESRQPLLVMVTEASFSSEEPTDYSAYAGVPCRDAEASALVLTGGGPHTGQDMMPWTLALPFLETRLALP